MCTLFVKDYYGKENQTLFINNELNKILSVVVQQVQKH
jgi:hypothetical protein